MTALNHLWRPLAVVPLLVSACTLSLLSTPTPAPSTSTPTAASASTLPSPTPVPTDPPQATASQEVAFCADDRPLELITQFQRAVRNSDGALLASLVNPEHGMDARLFRDGRVVNYDGSHAAALFDSTFAVNWGTAPGSGLETVGPFRELFVPDLLNVFGREFEIVCNQVRVGGTTYEASWPYPGIDFYSVYFPGTTQFDRMDWHTWLLGMQPVNGTQFLYAIMQLKWEP